MWLLLTGAFALADDAPLSVDDAVARALAQASDYQIATSSEGIAAAEAKNARARLLPAFVADGEATFNSPGAGTPGTQSYVSENSVLWYRATAGASGTVFGGTAGQARAAEDLLAAAHAGTEVARRELALATIDAYFAVALADAQLAAAKENSAVADELARVIALRLDAEEVPEVDALRARLAAAARKDERLQAEAGRDAAAADLGVLIGGPGDLKVAELRATDVDSGAVGAGVRGASPDVEATTAELDAAEAMVAATRAQYLPQLGYAVGYGFDTDTLGRDLPQHLGVIAGVTVTAPIFDWGIGARSVQAARLAADQAEATRQQAIRAAEAEWTVAASNARTAAQRDAILRASLPEATRNVDISLARYVDGEGDLFEVTEAQQTLIDARYASNSALAEYEIALAHLRLLEGR